MSILSLAPALPRAQRRYDPRPAALLGLSVLSYALLTRRRRPEPEEADIELDLSGLAEDAPTWLAQLTERNDD